MSRLRNCISAPLILSALLAACSPSGENAASDRADVEAALVALGLTPSDRISWQERTIADGDVRFDAFTLVDEDGTLRAGALTLERPRLEGDSPIVDAFHFESATIEYADGEARFDALRLREPGSALIDAASAFFKGEENEPQLLADGQSFEALSLEGFSVNVLSENETPILLSIEALALAGFDSEELDQLILSSLEFETTGESGDRVTVALDAVELEGFQSDIVGMAAARPFSGGLNIGETYERFAVDGLNVDAGGLRIAMPSFSGEIETRSGAVVAATLSMPALVMSADPGAGALGSQFASALDQLGFEALDLSLQSTTVYDAATDRVRTEGENALVLRDAFTISVEQDFSGVARYGEAYAAWLADAQPGQGTPPAEVLGALELNRFVLELRDEALLDSLFASMAAQQNSTPEAVRSQASGLAAMAVLFAGSAVEPAILQSAQAGLIGFISSGGTLTIALEPAEPISLDQLSGGPLPPEAGVSITHTPPD